MDRSEPIPDHRAHYKEHGWAQIKRVLPIEVADATLYKMQQELGGGLGKLQRRLHQDFSDQQARI